MIKIIYFIIVVTTIIGCDNSATDTKNYDTSGIDTLTTIDNSKDLVVINNDSIKISAVDLCKDYVANEVKADHDYKGKLITVTGTIQDIKKGLSDDIFIVLTGSERFRAVQCYCNDNTEAQKLVKGNTATFRGTCTGLLGNVILENCNLLNAESK